MGYLSCYFLRGKYECCFIFPWDHRCSEFRIARNVCMGSVLIKFPVLLNLGIVGKRFSQVGKTLA